MAFSLDASDLMEMMGDKMGEELEEPIDTIMNFKAMFDEKRDSINQLPAYRQAKLKALENFSLGMRVNPEEEVMNIRLFTDFTSVAELKDMFEVMQELQKMEKEMSAETDTLFDQPNPTSLKFKYENNVFKREVAVLDEELLNIQIDSLRSSGAMMMYASSDYTLKYHFPRPVKSVSDTTATLSIDRKTVTVKRSFEEYLENPKTLNIEFVLEDR